MAFNVVVLFATAGLLGACGYAEWPPKSEVRRQVEGEPAQPAQSAAFIGATAVVAGRGDTVYGMSKRHGVSMRAIIEANNLAAPFHLRIGQRIVLPRDPEYVVRKGDTLSEIAESRNLGMYDIARVNNLKPPYTIYVGQRLRLPGAASASVNTVAVSPSIGNQSTAAKPTPLPSKPPAWAEAGKTKSSAPAPVAAKTPSKAAPRSIPKPPAASGRGFIWPVQGRVISSYGAKAKGLRNDGINIAAARGTPVRAAQNGVVVYAGNELRGFGNLVLIKHAGGWVSAYAHSERLLVKRGDKVKKGQSIARVGSTGSVTSPQLHFELRKGRRARDPRKYLTRA